MLKGSEQAFPVSIPGHTYADGSCELPSTVDGLTKREYFAAMALQGILANYFKECPLGSMEEMAKDAVMIADRLIEAINTTDNRP